MDIYHAWFNRKPEVDDQELADNIAAFMGHLKERGLIEGHRLMRCKLGLAPRALRDFHLMIETRDMAQLDQAFQAVSARAEPEEGFHHGVNGLVQDVMFALYRDFPDPQRQQGQERF